LDYTLSNWLTLDNQEIARIVAAKASIAVVYINGTRRWFLTQSKDWADYPKIIGEAQRALSQLFFDHGVQTLIKPIVGHDVLKRAPEYQQAAIEQGLAELASPDYRAWFHRVQVRLSFYGNWSAILTGLGFVKIVDMFHELMAETRHYTHHGILFGVFADEEVGRIVSMAKHAAHGEELLQEYYGQPVGPVNFIVGSGQPAIWDIPLLNINAASLYFLQAPTFCLNKETLRCILYDHLYQRVNDDDLYDNLNPEEWASLEVLGIGQRTRKGWIAT
jgi:hypothetical protein